MHWLNEFAVQEGKGKRKLPIFASLNVALYATPRPSGSWTRCASGSTSWGATGGCFSSSATSRPIPRRSTSTPPSRVRTLGRYPIAADLAQVRVDVPKFEPFDQWLKGRPEAETILRARK